MQRTYAGGGFNTSTGDLRYLKLDCSNDPLTGELEVNRSITDVSGTFYDHRANLELASASGASCIAYGIRTDVTREAGGSYSNDTGLGGITGIVASVSSNLVDYENTGAANRTTVNNGLFSSITVSGTMTQSGAGTITNYARAGYFSALNLTSGDVTALTYGLYVNSTGSASGTSTAYGIYSKATGADTNWAGYFDGDVNVDGDITVTGTVDGVDLANVVTSSAVLANHTILRGDGGARGSQDSGVTIDDSDNVTGLTSLNVTRNPAAGTTFTLSHTLTATTGLDTACQSTFGYWDEIVTATSGSIIGNYINLIKTGADTNASELDLWGIYCTASNTGSTATGTKKTFGIFSHAYGDTAGTSTTYGLYVGASGADTNNSIYSSAGTVDIRLAGYNGHKIIHAGNSLATGFDYVYGIAALSDTCASYVSYHEAATTGTFTQYGSKIFTNEDAVKTAGNHTHIALTSQSYLDRAHTSTGTLTVYGAKLTGSQTGSTDAGTRISYGAYCAAVGDTAGTSTTYGVYSTATGADTNYSIYSNAGNIYVGLAADEGVVFKGSASQTAKMLDIKDSSDASMAWITAEGKIQTNKGVRTDSTAWVDSLSVWTGGEFVPEHTNGVGNYDFTGGAAESLFIRTAGDAFTSADVGNFINLTSGTYKGAKARITEYIDGDNVVVFGPGWDADQTGVTYKIFPPPTFIIADEHNMASLLSTNGSFFIGSDLGTGWCPSKVSTSSLFKVKMKAETGCDDIDSMMIETDCNGNSGIDGLQIKHILGTLATGQISQALQINLDESSATGGHIDGIEITTTDTCASCDKDAIHVASGFDTALLVSGASSEDPGFGYETTSGTSTDRVNGGTADTTAFLSSSASDLEIFDNNGDDILIGSASKFELIEVILTVLSSKDIDATFWYSKADNNWTLLPGVDDSTAGFTKNGLISFAAPADWTKDDQDRDGNAITDAYYIAITRTVGGTIPTLPTEDYFKTYLERAGDTGMNIYGDGTIKLPYLTAAPASLDNGRMWMEADGLHIYYAGAEKLVAGV